MNILEISKIYSSFGNKIAQNLSSSNLLKDFLLNNSTNQIMKNIRNFNFSDLENARKILLKNNEEEKLEIILNEIEFRKKSFEDEE